MILTCSICKQIIKNISVSKKYLVRDDYRRNGPVDKTYYARADREYFDCEVRAIFYTCGCDSQQVVKGPDLNDFVRDSDSIRSADIAKARYGTIIVS